MGSTKQQSRQKCPICAHCIASDLMGTVATLSDPTPGQIGRYPSRHPWGMEGLWQKLQDQESRAWPKNQVATYRGSSGRESHPEWGWSLHVWECHWPAAKHRDEVGSIRWAHEGQPFLPWLPIDDIRNSLFDAVLASKHQELNTRSCYLILGRFGNSPYGIEKHPGWIFLIYGWWFRNPAITTWDGKNRRKYLAHLRLASFP